MHLSLDEHQNGWFPAVRIGFHGTTDLLLGATVLALCFGALVYLIPGCRRTYSSIGWTGTSMLSSLFANIYTTAEESIQLLYRTIILIPISWYAVAALTIIPIAVDIPRWAGVLYLLSYCLANTWVLVCGIQPAANTKKEKKDDAILSVPDTTGRMRVASTQIFAGMRITIQS